MFVACLLLSLIAYSFQGVLLSHLARNYDLLWVSTARGLGLLVVMAPLGLLATSEQSAAVPSILVPLTLACASAFAANIAQTHAVRHLPMAIAVACGQSAAAVFTLGMDLLRGGSLPTPGELWSVAGIICGVMVLAQVSSRGRTIAPDARPWRGVGSCVVFGITMAVALNALKLCSESVGPFMSAWLWEGGIGLVGLLCVTTRGLLHRWQGRAAPSISWPVGLKIACCSSPTLIGTGAYTYATTIGHLAVASGVLTAMMVTTAIFARILYREYLSRFQWAIIFSILACLIALAWVQYASSGA